MKCTNQAPNSVLGKSNDHALDVQRLNPAGNICIKHVFMGVRRLSMRTLDVLNRKNLNDPPHQIDNCPDDDIGPYLVGYCLNHLE